MPKPTIVYWNNMPTPYVVGRFNAIVRRGNLDFQAWFNGERESDRSWDVRPQDWAFPARYIPATSVAGRLLHVPSQELASISPDLLVSLYGDASFACGVCVARLKAGRVALRVLPTYDTWLKRSWVKEIAKHVLLRGVDAAKVPGQDGASVAARYGLPPNRVFSVTQSVDISHFATASQLDTEVRHQERDRRSLSGCVFLYTGRLWSGKGLDHLFDAFEALTRQGYEASLLVVGDGIDEDLYRSRASGVPNIHFEGFVQPEDLPRLYGIADVFVFPTLGDPHGLVVEEAMAAGLPVISSDAAGDIANRLPEGDAGYITRNGNTESLLQAMQRLSGDEQLRVSMSRRARELVVSRSHEAYAIDFEAFVEKALEIPRRTGLGPALMGAAGNGLLRGLPSREVAPLLGPFSET